MLMPTENRISGGIARRHADSASPSSSRERMTANHMRLRRAYSGFQSSWRLLPGWRRRWIGDSAPRVSLPHDALVKTGMLVSDCLDTVSAARPLTGLQPHLAGTLGVSQKIDDMRGQQFGRSRGDDRARHSVFDDLAASRNGRGDNWQFGQTGLE